MNDQPPKPNARSKMIWVLVGLSPIPIVLVELWLATLHQANMNTVANTIVFFNVIPSSVGAIQLMRNSNFEVPTRIFLGLLLATGFYAANFIGGFAGCCMISGVRVH